MRLGDIIILFEGLICLYSFIFYKKMKLYNIEFFAWMYTIIFGVELFIRLSGIQCNLNHTFHNYFDLLQMILWVVLFYMNTQVYKNIILLISFICILFFIFNIVFIQTQNGCLTTHSIALNYLSISIIAILYFIEIIYHKGVFQFFSLPLFWISLGVFMYSLIAAPYYAMYNYLDSTYDKVYEVYDNIILFLTIASYILTIVGLLTIHRKK